MLDVEYLIDPPPLKRPLVYCYRTGVLRRAMRNLLIEQASARGRELNLCSPTGLLITPTSGFYDVINFCDWPGYARAREKPLQDIVSLLTSGREPNIVLFLPPGCQLIRHPDWPLIKASCLVVTEEKVSSKTLVPVLRYLDRTTDLYLEPQMDSSGFVELFRALVKSCEYDLDQFAYVFDATILTCSDPGTNTLASRNGQATAATGEYGAPMRLLRSFVEKAQTSDSAKFIRALEARYSDGSRLREVIKELFRLSTHLVQTSSGVPRHMRAGAPEGAPGSEGFLWAAILLANEEQFLEAERHAETGRRGGPERFFLVLHVLCAEFVRRCGLPGENDPLGGLWSGLRESVARAAAADTNDWLEAAKFKLVDSLGIELAPYREKRSWLGRLGVDASSAAAEWTRRNEEPRTNHGARPSKAALNVPLPPSFDRILGQPRLVTALRERLLDNHHQLGLVLYGPEGVGKHTIARLYSKAIFCTSDKATAPCNTCSACDTFDKGQLDFIDYDAMDDDEGDGARKFAETCRWNPMSGQRVIVVRNADRYATAGFDPLLKTLESPPTPTTFIFLASDLKGVREAGRSRCAVYRLRPLTSSVAQQLAESMCEARGFEIESSALQLLVSASGGLPGDLQRLINAAATVEARTLEATRSALELDWSDETMIRWRGALGLGEIVGVPVRDVSREEMLRRARVLWWQILVHTVGEGEPQLEVDAAFSGVGGPYFDSLVTACMTIAEHRRQTFAGFWSSVAQVIGLDDYTDVGELFAAVQLAMTKGAGAPVGGGSISYVV